MTFADMQDDEKYNEFHAFVTQITRIFQLIRKQGLSIHQHGMAQQADPAVEQMIDDVLEEWPADGVMTGNFVLGQERHIHIGFIGVPCNGAIPLNVAAYATYQMALGIVEMLDKSYPAPLGPILALVAREALRAQYYGRIGNERSDALGHVFGDDTDDMVGELLGIVSSSLPFQPEFIELLNIAVADAIKKHTGEDDFDFSSHEGEDDDDD